MIQLPSMFGSGMVIGKEAKVWGWTAPNNKVSAVFRGVGYESTAGADGRFDFTFTSTEYGGPHVLTIGDITIRDVYIGRVWLCGGQSNMEGPLSRCRLAFGAYIKEDTRIRAFQVEKGLKFDSPARDVNGKWQPATDEALDSMYAVPYFFAKELLESGVLEEDAVIGLICTPAGGTPIEGWLPEELIKDSLDFSNALNPLKEPGYTERLTKEDDNRIGTWQRDLAAKDIGLKEGWNSPDYDDSSWANRMLLDPSGLPNYGAVWLRKRLHLPKMPGSAVLRFGRAVNSVKVFVNGDEVISIDYMYPPCNCILPEGLLQEGDNLIAVRIVGESHNPSFVPGKEYSLEYSLQENPIDLSGDWKWRVGTVMPQCEPGVWLYNGPTGVYNHMLAPVLGYSIDGIIWYQGESNTGQPGDYKELFTSFAAHVRKYYNEELPIIFTQLANFIDPQQSNRFVPGENWAELREQQRCCLDISNTAMAVAIDCGEWNDLHPVDKKTVGERLALHARRMLYNEDIVSDGPTVDRIESANGILTIYFRHAKGLWAKNGHPLLDVIDKQGDTHRLYAVINGECLTTDVGDIKVSKVRFGWVDCPPVTLYNAHGLPASPFEINYP